MMKKTNPGLVGKSCTGSSYAINLEAGKNDNHKKMR